MLFKQLLRDKYSKLPPGQKKTAEYLSENLEQSIFYTAAKIAKEVGVSETTVIRLSYSLDFDSFSDMQKCMQQQFFKNGHINDSLSDKDNDIDSGQVNPFTNIIDKDISILEQMLSHIKMTDLWNTVDSLIQADQVIIAGYRLSYAAAYWFYLKLSMLRKNVTLLPSTFNTFEEIPLSNLNGNSVVFIISFPRYAREALSIAEYVQEREAQLITATDRLLSPVGQLSDIVFTVDLNISSNNLYSISSIISLLNIITSGIEMKEPESTSQRIQKLHDISSKFKSYIE